ncbi:major facilitator transporter [Candidatus Magnetobacterium bavaricum]|uniref:Major facilitator transporter n=1 Tax=Candidatus Magnetobacterium bavaricum TaxID=29290 RepID=A0A0F3GVK6_9BACT|nr:major facilitator transporter [Candidatus Magnetobacterium bavaricum]
MVNVFFKIRGVGTYRFSALRVRDFRLFFTGQAISLIGTWMQQTALGWLVYSITRSSFYLGLMALALSLPVLFFTLAGGVIADRFKKRNVLIATQALSMIPAALLTIIAYTGGTNIWLILAIATILGTVNSIDIPVRQSFIIEITGRENLLNAVALNATMFHTARVIGPLISGIVIEYYGAALCFYINVLSFLPVVYALWSIQLKQEANAGKSNGLVRDFAAALSFIRDNGRIMYIILTVTVFSLFGIPFSQFLPVFADVVFDSGAKGYGYMMSAVGLGSALAGVIIAFRGDIQKKRLYMSITSVIFPFALFIFALSGNFLLSLASLCVMGFNMVSFLATANSYVQLKTRDELRGRVMSIYTMMFLGMAPLGAAFMGTLAQGIGIQKTIAINAVVCLGGVLFFRNKWK